MTDVTVDQKRSELPPIDPDAKIPDAVKKRAAEVEAFYAAQGQAPLPDSVASPSPLAQEAPIPQAVTTPASQDVPAPPAEPPAQEAPVDWRRQYHAMKGRFDAAQQAIAQMEDQLAQVGEELVRTQQSPPQAPRPQPRTPAYLTQQDVQNYGTDLIDFTQRAAAQYVAPHLQRVEQENAQLRQQLAEETRKAMHDRVEMAVPNWREIDNNSRWHQWLRLPEMLSGRIRQQLLNDATAAGNASRVISFFNQFLNEERATGNMESSPASPPHQAPREPAIPLASLAAPGRARPASGGEASVPPDKPTYTRAQIAANYSLHRRGAFAGRDAEWNRLEHDMVAAANEGRVRT